MDMKAFAAPASSARDMGRHMRGGKVVGARATKVREPKRACARFSAGRPGEVWLPDKIDFD